MLLHELKLMLRPISCTERISVTWASARLLSPQAKAYVTAQADAYATPDKLHRADFRNMGFSPSLIPTS